MDGVYGEVVACYPVDDVSLLVSKDRVTARVPPPPTSSWGDCRPDVDLDTARRMVDGEVSWLLVVSDGGDGRC